MGIKKNIFINLSNHPSKNWSKEQKEAVINLIPNAEIVDVAFPMVDSLMNESEILKLSEQILTEITAYNPSVVMCQGEFGLTFCMVTLLKGMGIKTVYGCSERRTTERQTPNGTEKISTFSFVKFREY